MIKEHTLWTEKYRPGTIEECVLPERLKTIFRGIVEQQFMPNMLLSGKPGVGKTTAALALCKEVNSDHMMFNASSEGNIETVKNDIFRFATSTSLFVQGRKVVLLDEADFMSSSAQAALRSFMERVSRNAAFVFTCNDKSKLMDALQSRCAVIEFAFTEDERSEMVPQFLKRAKYILANEGFGCDEVSLRELTQQYFPDFRRVLNELQRSALALCGRT